MSTGAVFNSWKGKEDLFIDAFPDDHQRRRVAEGICVGLLGEHAWESTTRAHRDLFLQAADRAMASPAITQKAA
jgi:hypothetical protein